MDHAVECLGVQPAGLAEMRVAGFDGPMAAPLGAWRSPWVRRARTAGRLVEKSLFKRLGGGAGPSIYGIKSGYRHARTALDFDDTPNTDEWQREVYELARELMSEHAMRSVIDVGCGSGFKLVELLGEYETTGIEVERTWEWLQTKYPSRRWLRSSEAARAPLEADLVVCADVIEHVANPDAFMGFLSGIRCSRLVISTPDRELVAGVDDAGPPGNPAHYREWSAPEFERYVGLWFEVESRADFREGSSTQALVCKPR